jgi:hypothetical protein
MSFLSKPLSNFSDMHKEPVAALHVTLKAQGCTGVRAQLFHAHFVDIYDEQVHLLGICEVGDTGSAVPDCALQTGPELGDLFASRILCDDNSDNASGSSLHEVARNVPIMMDVMSFEILNFSRDFGELLARLYVGRSFLDLLEDRAAFVKWAQQYAHMKFHGSATDITSSHSSRAVKLCCGQLSVKTVCTIRSSPDVHECVEDVVPSKFPVCLTLSSFKYMRRRSRREKFTASSAQASTTILL